MKEDEAVEAGNNYNYKSQVTKAECNKTFAVLKLIERLYKYG